MKGNGGKLERVVGICLLEGFLLAGISAAPFAQAAAPGDLVPAKVLRLGLDPNSGAPVVFLGDPGEERALPIWIGPCEANALNSEMEGTKPPRPLTHDLTGNIIGKLKAKIQKVIITHAKDGIYYATIVIEREGSLVEVDARPSDSIVLAQKTGCPIFISRTLYNEHTVALREKGAEEAYGLTVQELNPSLAASFSFPSTQGVLVSDVRAGSQAEKDGFQRGNILVEAAGEKISDVKAFRKALSAKTPVKVKVFYQGNTISRTLNLK